MPTGQSEHRDEVQFRISIPDAIDGQSTKGAWDPSNDWSYEGVEDCDNIKVSAAYNKHITMYVNDILVWGTEPDGTSAVVSAELGGSGGETPEPTEVPEQPTASNAPTVPSSGEYLAGDANCDGKVTIADSTAILQHLGNQDKYGLSKQGAINADVNGEAGVSTDDALTIAKVDAKLIKAEDLPIKK